MVHRSLTARGALILGCTAVGGLLVGIGGIQLGLLEPFDGFKIAAGLGLLFGLLAVIASLVALVRTGKRQRLLGAGLRLLQAIGQQLRLPQRETTERLISYHFRCTELCHRLREQRHGVSDASGEGIRRAQGRSRHGEKAREVRVLAEAHGPFEPREGPGQVALAEIQETKPVIGTHKAPGVRNRLGNPQPFFPEGTALSEQAELGMTRGEPGTGGHGGQENLAEALVAPRPIERRHRNVNRPTIIALGLIGLAEVLVRPQVNLPASRGEREDALGSSDCLVILTHLVAMVCQKEQDPPQPTRVIKSYSERFGLA